MADEIQLVGDDDGLAIFGDRAAIERFLNSVGLLSVSKDIELGGLGRALDVGAGVARTASDIAVGSGRYVKLTAESAHRVAELGLMETDTPGICYAMLGDPGRIGGWIKIETGVGSLFGNPAILSGVAGLMTQLARQAEAAELKALLVKMDEKLDDMRRGQKGAVVAKLHRAARAIEQAQYILENSGNRETAWDKIQCESGTLLEVEGAALDALNALADKVRGKSDVRKAAKAAREAASEVTFWLAVLAWCMQLQDEFAVLEIDHVLDSAPGDLDGHRLGLIAAKKHRLEKVIATTGRLADCVDQAGAMANSNVLLHPIAARLAVESANFTRALIGDFHVALEVEAQREPMRAIGWWDALGDPEQRRSASEEAEPVAKVAVAVVSVASLVVPGARRFMKKP